MSVTIDRQLDSGKIALKFEIPDTAHHGPVSVVGSFNEWTPGADPFVNTGDRLVAVVVVEPEPLVFFRYLGSDGAWFDDPDAADGILHLAETETSSEAEDSDFTVAAEPNPSPETESAALQEPEGSASPNGRAVDDGETVTDVPA